MISSLIGIRSLDSVTTLPVFSLCFHYFIDTLFLDLCTNENNNEHNLMSKYSFYMVFKIVMNFKNDILS